MKYLSFLFSKTKYSRKKIIFALFITALCSLTSIIAPLFIQKIVDNGIMAKDIKILLTYAVIYLLFQLLTVLFGTLGLYLSEASATKILIDYKSSILEKLYSLQVHNFYKYQTYEFRAMISYSIDNLKFFFSDLPRVIVEIAIIIIFSCFCITAVSPKIFIFIIICVFVYVLLYLLTRKVLSHLSEQLYETDKIYYEKINTVCKNIDEFFFNAGIPNIKTFLSKDYKNIQKVSEKQEFIESLSAFISQLFSSCLILLIYIFLAKEISLGTLLMTVSFAQIIFPLIETLFEMVNYWIQLKPCIDEAKRIDELDMTSEKTIEIQNTQNSHYFINNLSINYDEKQIFNNLNLKFNKTGLYIIKGENGKGKSTLLKALNSMCPVSDGETNINGDNCVFLQQENYLIPGTLLFNITLSEAEENPSDIISTIASKLNIESKILSLEKGYKTIIDFNDSHFSGGELRKICILRALYQAVKYEKEIIMLDEPDSSLDNESVQKLFGYLAELSKNKLIVVVSHSDDLLDKEKINYIFI